MLQLAHVGRFWFALIGLIVMIGAVWQASGWGYQTRLMPMVVGVIGIVLFAVELLAAVRWRSGPQPASQPVAEREARAVGDRNERRSVIMAVALVLYVAALYYIGFVPSSLAFLAITLYVLGTKQLLKVIGISVGTVLAVYLSLSTLLQVPLP